MPKRSIAPGVWRKLLWRLGRCQTAYLKRRIQSCGGAILASRAHYAAIVGVETPEAVVACTGLQRKGTDHAVGFRRAGRVLNLVIDALCELCRCADWLPQRFQFPWVSAVLRRGVVYQRGPHLAQSLRGASLRLRRGIPLALRYDEPQEAPDRGEEHAQQDPPAQQDLPQGGLGRRCPCFEDGLRQVGAAVRADFRGLV